MRFMATCIYVAHREIEWRILRSHGAAEPAEVGNAVKDAISAPRIGVQGKSRGLDSPRKKHGFLSKANGRVVHRKGFAKTYSTNVVEGA